MFSELALLFAGPGLLGDIRKSVLDDNVLGKSSASGRILTLQRLSELYSFDISEVIFRVFSGLCQLDPAALPQLAILMAVARDPLLRASARSVLGLTEGSQLMRDNVRDAIASVVGTRMNPAVLDKVVRNVASSWTKSGHLSGRTIKRRHHIRANQTALAFALWLAQRAGVAAGDTFDNGWVRVLDLEPVSARKLAERAHAARLIVFRSIGESFELDTSALERMPRS
ncbi:MAG: hypothetical protein WBQ17_14330 [Rhizomicrobium sp.]